MSGDLPPPLTAARVLLGWRLDSSVAVGLAAVAALYLWGVLRLARRGDAWSPLRSASFLFGGLGTVAVATMSGLAAYDDVLFSAHMAQHMVLTMLSPVFLALGAPLTLAVRALPLSGRRRLLKVTHSRVAGWVLHPLVGTFLFIGTPFGLYFSGAYEATLRSEWLHALLHAHFLLVGCLFFWPLLGLDPLPRRLPHPLRLLLVFVTMPFHAFLGVAILSAGSVIAGDWYAGLHRPWGGTLLADQHTGGGLLWASGDVIGLLLVGVVAVQWMHADERTARREDRRLDRLEAQQAAAGVSAQDAALAAYNARLAALSRRAGR